MKLLATLKAKGIEDKDYALFKQRLASRAVIFDGPKVALVYVKNPHYYMLPGGGVEKHETMIEGLHREAQEELGRGIEIVSEIGKVKSYIVRWHNDQTDYGYIAKVTSRAGRTTPTDFEVEEGHEIVWADNIEEAIALMEAARPQFEDGQLIQLRDSLFLRKVLGE